MIHIIAGNGSGVFGGDEGLSVNAQLNYPYGIAVGPNDEVYIADTDNHRIRKISKNGLISTIAGNDRYGFSGDGNLAINARLNSPCGVAVNSNGEIYIADTKHHRIRKIAPNGLISTIAGNGKQGFSGDGGLATSAKLHTPHGLAVSESGEIYIADTFNHRIRKITPDGFISTIVGDGKEGFSGDGGLATNTRLSRPYGIAISPSGEVYIADTVNHRIRKIAENGLISTIAGNGRNGFGGDGGLATDAQLYQPCDIAVSENGEIYIADTCNHRIRKISKNGFISTISGTYKDGLDGGDVLAKNARLFYPTGIDMSPSGELYIADTNNCRICKIDGLCPSGRIMGRNLKKYERDYASGGLVCFQPLLAKLAPTFYEFVLSAGTLLNVNEKHIVQHLIDSLMYGSKLHLDDLESGCVVDWLFVLGMTEDSEFLEVKTRLLIDFMDAFTADSIAVILERLDTLKERSVALNPLLDKMIDFTLGRAIPVLRSSPSLATNRIIQKHAVQILLKMHQSELVPILLTETNREETGGIESLFNDPTMSDIRILLGEREWYCHRTILSSYSSYFEALFDKNCPFNDLEDGTYRIDCTEFGEGLHEVIIKYCYGLFGECVISDSVTIPLFECASFYGMNQLVEYCGGEVVLSTGNYFEVASQLGHYPCETLCAKFVEFGLANLKSLDMSEDKLASLPEQIKEKLSWKFIQVTK